MVKKRSFKYVKSGIYKLSNSQQLSHLFVVIKAQFIGKETNFWDGKWWSKIWNQTTFRKNEEYRSSPAEQRGGVYVSIVQEVDHVNKTIALTFHCEKFVKIQSF